MTKRRLGLVAYPTAGTLAGIACGAVEVGLVASAGRLETPAAALIPALGRAGLAGLILGSIALLLALPRSRKVHLALLGAGALAFGTLAAIGAYKRGAGVWETGAWLPLGALMTVGVAGVLAFSLGSRWPRLIGVVLALLAVACLRVDPGGYRGTYLSLDLLLGGIGGGLMAMALACWLRSDRGLVVGLVVCVAALGAFRLFPGDDDARSNLLAASPRIAWVDRVLAERGLVPARDLEAGPVDRIGWEDLVRPPPWSPYVLSRSLEWFEQCDGKPPRNVLWITLDAVRADVTGLHGGACTPNLDALAKTGFAFRNAWSQAPGTAFSMESFTTSRYPSRSAVALGWATGTEKVKFPPIAEYMTEQGYRTGFITGLDEKTLNLYTFERLKRGFTELVTSPGEPDALQTAEQAAAWLAETDARPFFAWVHFFDPHNPYVPRGDVPGSATERERYEGEVRYADAGLGRVLEALREAGHEDDTIVIVHADHGEAFGEHGRYWHATSYYDTQLHIPLVIRVPRLGHAELEQPASNMDLFPTLCDLLPVEDRPSYLQGHSLLTTFLDPEVDYPRAMLAETLIVDPDDSWPGDRIRVVSDGRWKLIEWRSSGTRLLFDRKADPGETRNLAAGSGEIVARLRGYLAAFDRYLDEGDARLGAARSSSWAEVRAALDSPDLAVRRPVLEELWTGRRRDLLLPLDDAAAELRPAVAHQALVILDTILTADLTEKVTDATRLPSSPSALRFRLLERYARSARYWGLPAPTPTPPLAGLESFAMTEIRAARGDELARRDLEHCEPASRDHWTWLAPVLGRGGDGPAGPLVVNRSLRNDGKDELLLRGLRSLEGQPDQLSAAVVRLWPSSERRVNPRTYQRIVELVINLPSAARMVALLALHPRATPGDQIRIVTALEEGAPGWTPEEIREAALRWSQGRHREGTEEARAPLEQALSLIPKSIPMNALRTEARRALTQTARGVDGLSVSAAGLASRPGENAEGPPVITVSLARGASPVAIGPGWSEKIELAWEGPSTVVAATAWLPRTVLAPGATVSVVAPCDYPRGAGSYGLVARVGGRIVPWATAAPEYEVRNTRAWAGSAVAQAISAWPLPARPLPDGAGIELFEDAHGGFVLPVMELPAGDVTITLELTAWFEGAEPWIPTAYTEAAPGAVVPCQAAKRGEASTLTARVRCPGGTIELGVRWPLPAALVHLRGVRVEMR